MAKRKQNFQSFQSSKGGRFITIYFDMINSMAWQQLSGNSIKLYLYMLSKYNVKYVNNQIDYCNKNDISVPKSEYSKLMSNHTFQKCIDELIDYGFIRVVKYKPITGARKVIIYAFNNMWQKYGTKDFVIKDEWKRSNNKAYI